MHTSYDKPAAIVVLPAASGGRITDRRLRYWLAQSDVVRQDFTAPVLSTLLCELRAEPPTAALAALRQWGQTGDRPAAWVAAADPVYLEARLQHLCLHALEGRVSRQEVRQLTDHLQATLGGEPGIGFVQVGACIYVTAHAAFATATVPSTAIDGASLEGYLPVGDGEGAHRRLTSEIEMALHGHAVNLERESTGLAPVNALWLWGGGTAPEQAVAPLPPLFADDPLLNGYWRSRTADCEPWPGSVANCLQRSAGGFVAVASAADEPQVLAALLAELRAAVQGGRLERLVLWFRDGLRAEIRRSHSLRFWRLRNTLLEKGPAGS